MPARDAKSVRLPPTSRPCARPRTTGQVLYFRTASVSFRIRGFVITGVPAWKTTRFISRVENSVQDESPFGP